MGPLLQECCAGAEPLAPASTGPIGAQPVEGDTVDVAVKDLRHCVAGSDAWLLLVGVESMGIPRSWMCEPGVFPDLEDGCLVLEMRACGRVLRETTSHVPMYAIGDLDEDRTGRNMLEDLPKLKDAVMTQRERRNGAEVRHVPCERRDVEWHENRGSKDSRNAGAHRRCPRAGRETLGSSRRCRNQRRPRRLRG